METHKTGQATDDLSALLKEAYKEALEPYHGWMLRQLFNVIIYIYILHNYIIIHLYYILYFYIFYNTFFNMHIYLVKNDITTFKH